MAGQTPCATKLRLLLSYEPDTGFLRWRRSARRGYKPGDLAGSVHRARNNYRIVRLEGRGYYAHRLIWKMMTGKDSLVVVDHADGDTLNNAWANLREASAGENGHNRRLNKNNKSGVKGVHPDGGKWRAVIKRNGEKFDLGRFKTAAAARIEIEALRRNLHADFARMQ